MLLWGSSFEPLGLEVRRTNVHALAILQKGPKMRLALVGQHRGSVGPAYSSLGFGPHSKGPILFSPTTDEAVPKRLALPLQTCSRRFLICLSCHNRQQLKNKKTVSLFTSSNQPGHLLACRMQRPCVLHFAH